MDVPILHFLQALLMGTLVAEAEDRESGLSDAVLRQPFLAAALGFTFLILFLEAGFLVKSATFKLPEQALAGELLFGDLQGFFDIVIEDFDFHSSYVSPSNTVHRS